MTLPTMLPHTRAEMLAWCREVDDGPWASLAVPERITYTSHDWTVDLAAAAALTERVRLWTTIVILPAHDAVAVAKQLASIDVLSDGRLTVGVGVGGREHDYRAIGGSFERRWQRMDEQVATHAADLGTASRRSRAPIRSGRRPVQDPAVRRSSPASWGRRRSRARRAGPTASTARGPWTATATRWRPRSRRSATRGRTPGAPSAPHLSSSIWYALGDGRRGAPAHVRVQLHEDHRRGRRRLGGGVDGHVLHARRAATSGRQRTRRRRRRVLPRAHHRPTPTSSRARATRSGLAERRMRRRRAARRASPPRSGWTTTATRRSATGSSRCGRRGCTRPDLTEIGMLAFEGQMPDEPGQPPAGHSTGTAPTPSSRRRRWRRRSSSWACPAAARPRSATCSRRDPDNRSLLGVGGDATRSRRPTTATYQTDPRFEAARNADEPDRAAQPRVQGDPPRRARRRDGVHGAPRAALPEPHLLDRVQPADVRRMVAPVDVGGCVRLPPAGAPGAPVGVPGPVAAEVAAVRPVARRAVRRPIPTRGSSSPTATR